MNVALAKPWTRERFFAWAERQNGRYEFDGEKPVLMTGGTNIHSRIIRNVQYALHSRLRGSTFESLGPDAGLATVRNAVRYPDAVVTGEKNINLAHTVDGVSSVFEVISPTSGRTDRIIKVREYAAVPTIRCYVILEYTTQGLTVLRREAASDPWMATTLGEGDMLGLPEYGIEIPVAEFYDGIDLGEFVEED